MKKGDKMRGLNGFVTYALLRMVRGHTATVLCHQLNDVRFEITRISHGADIGPCILSFMGK
jgi:hypothetical protein